ncbi:unnamed protein product [Euphydryas editha]|uniref:Endonuclease/exonuclease/phosphatase domain-containing protein n=1 Tax=Euphydryas editha TaxID=104508 RepID=A0AAU9V4D6_EUPED|nr:unnamed protein product [Euphydryas editha]
MSNPPSPDGVSISNSFSELPITDNAQGNYQPKEKKPSKPPPIILYGVEDVNKLTEFLETTAERSTFNYKIINKNQIRIITKDVNIYKNLISRIREKGLIGHTFNIKEERSYRLVIKNLHHTTPHNDIIDAFRETETHFTNSNHVNISNYNIYTTNHPDGTAHGGTAVVIRSSIEHYELPQLKTEHIQATSVSVQDKNGNFNVSSVYCPPKHKITEYQFTGYIDTLGPRFIAGGDWNAKHVHWGSRLITSRGRELKKTVDKNYLTTISTSEPTHWPTDPNKLPDVLDFFIMKGLPRLFYEIGSCLDGSSNHIPVILCKSANVLTQKNPRMYNRQTNWENFRSLLTDSLELNLSLKTEDEIDNATYSFTRAVQDACWKSTEEQTHKNPRHNQVPHEIRDMILEKRR